MRKRIVISLSGLIALGLVAVSCQVAAGRWWFDVAGSRAFSWSLLLKITLKAAMRPEVLHGLNILSILVIAIVLVKMLKPLEGPP